MDNLTIIAIVLSSVIAIGIAIAIYFVTRKKKRGIGSSEIGKNFEIG